LGTRSRRFTDHHEAKMPPAPSPSFLKRLLLAFEVFFHGGPPWGPPSLGFSAPQSGPPPCGCGFFWPPRGKPPYINHPRIFPPSRGFPIFLPTSEIGHNPPPPRPSPPSLSNRKGSKAQLGPTPFRKAGFSVREIQPPATGPFRAPFSPGPPRVLGPPHRSFRPGFFFSAPVFFFFSAPFFFLARAGYRPGRPGDFAAPLLKSPSPGPPKRKIFLFVAPPRPPAR